MTTWAKRRARLRAASRLADEIVRQRNIRVLPIDPFALARTERSRLKIAEEDFEDMFDGRLEFSKHSFKFLLFLNNKYDAHVREGRAKRTRFSLAHELGHFFLDHHRLFLMRGGKAHPSRSGFQVDDLCEREADAFAAGLLLPERLLASRLKLRELNASLISELSHEFQASTIATAWRIIDVTRKPCAIVVLKQNKILWRLPSEALSDFVYFRATDERIISEGAQLQWSKFGKGADVGALSTDGKLGQWFSTSRENIAETAVTESYFPLPYQDSLLVSLTMWEEDLVR